MIIRSWNCISNTKRNENARVDAYIPICFSKDAYINRLWKWNAWGGERVLSTHRRGSRIQMLLHLREALEVLENLIVFFPDYINGNSKAVIDNIKAVYSDGIKRIVQCFRHTFWWYCLNTSENLEILCLENKWLKDSNKSKMYYTF